MGRDVGRRGGQGRSRCRLVTLPSVRRGGRNGRAAEGLSGSIHAGSRPDGQPKVSIGSTPRHHHRIGALHHSQTTPFRFFHHCQEVWRGQAGREVGGDVKGTTGHGGIPISSGTSIPSATGVMGVAGSGRSEARGKRCRHYGEAVQDG